MNGIPGLASLTLETESLPDEAGKNLQSLIQSSRFLLQLINDTLDMLKIESSKTRLTLQPTNFGAVLADVVMLVMPTVSEKHQHLIVKKTGELQRFTPRKLLIKNLAGKRVLFVEDRPVNVAVGRKMLESKGVEVTHAENGRLAVKAFAASPVCGFDAILMDILMPE